MRSHTPLRLARVAVVGLGPWGLAALERLVAVTGRRGTELLVDVVEPGVPGAGIFALDTPDYLPLNTPCGQHLMFPSTDELPLPPYAKSLYEWASEQGYRWAGGKCRRTASGTAISPDDFLPRRLMGEWLHWSYRQIVASRPPNVRIQLWPVAALDIEPGPGGRELVHLDGGGVLAADHVILTTGHTPGTGGADLDGELPPYPVSLLDGAVASGETVAVAGLGLVAMDVITALTVGRGGRFEDDGGRLRYLASGREPWIRLFSRSGRPYAAKAVGASDPTGEYKPVICTPAAAARLRRSAGGHLSCEGVDFRRDFLPMIVAEMQVRYYRHCALLHGGGEQAAGAAVERLAAAWSAGSFEEAVAEMAATYGPFDPLGHLLGGGGNGFCSSEEYEKGVYTAVEADAAEALASGASPLKAAFETLRVLRDTMRTVIEFQGLDVESHVHFFSELANRFKALVAGPPVRRSLELLALMEAGVVRVPWGPSPTVESAPGGGFWIRSTQLAEPFEEHVDRLVRGYLEEPAVAGTRSPLIHNLAARGRIQPMAYGEVEVGSIALTRASQPVGRDASVQDRLWVFGSLTEGVRYFTQYVPSPKSRARAFADAEDCAEAILAGAGRLSAPRPLPGYDLLLPAG